MDKGKLLLSVERKLGNVWSLYGLFHGTKEEAPVNKLDGRIKAVYRKAHQLVLNWKVK